MLSTQVLACRQYRCVGCGAVTTVVPRGAAGDTVTIGLELGGETGCGMVAHAGGALLMTAGQAGGEPTLFLRAVDADGATIRSRMVLAHRTRVDQCRLRTSVDGTSIAAMWREAAGGLYVVFLDADGARRGPGTRVDVPGESIEGATVVSLPGGGWRVLRWNSDRLVMTSFPAP